jgi:formylglycine-generating enzyme required for sulfatase activity
MPLPHVILNVKDQAEMVLVPTGDFAFGIDETRVPKIVAEAGDDFDPIFKTERPRALVTVRDCYIDKYPVTNRQYAAFMQATGHKAPMFMADPTWNKSNSPVVGVSYRDAVAYAAWCGKRLPTEEEWERAARGTDERLWPWGNAFESLCCNSREWNAGKTTEVGTFPRGVSPVGAFDMAGNVWEFTSGDWEGFGKTIRGGSWRHGAAYCRTTCRWGTDPDLPGSTTVGFRCAMDVAKARIYGKAKA